MTAGERYTAKSLELLARADAEADPRMRADLENLAALFLRLAEETERNSKLTIEFVLPPEKEGDP